MSDRAEPSDAEPWVDPEFAAFVDLTEKDLLFGIYKNIRTIKRVIVFFVLLWVISVAVGVGVTVMNLLWWSRPG